MWRDRQAVLSNAIESNSCRGHNAGRYAMYRAWRHRQAGSPIISTKARRLSLNEDPAHHRMMNSRSKWRPRTAPPPPQLAHRRPQPAQHQCTLLQGSVAGEVGPPICIYERRRYSGRPSSSIWLARRQQWPPRHLAALWSASVARHRSLACSGRYRPPPRHANCNGCPLPAHATVLGDQLQMPVALGRRGLCHCACTALERGGTMTAASG